MASTVKIIYSYVKLLVIWTVPHLARSLRLSYSPGAMRECSPGAAFILCDTARGRSSQLVVGVPVAGILNSWMCILEDPQNINQLHARCRWNSRACDITLAPAPWSEAARCTPHRRKDCSIMERKPSSPSSSSSPLMNPSHTCHSKFIAAEAPKQPPAANETRTWKSERRKSTLIGPRVWAAFRKEQKMPEWFTARDPTTVNNHGAVDHQEVAPALLKRHRERNTQWSAENFETVLTGAASATPGSKERRVTNRQRGRMTLGRFMIDMSSRHPEGEAMLPIIKAVGKACTAVSRLVRQVQHSNVLGPQDPDTLLKVADVREEEMRELQTLANNIFLKGLCQPHVMSCVASSDESVVRMCSAVVGEDSHGGEYAAVFTPLDRSVDLGAGLQCATIFGIVRTSGPALEGKLTAGPSTIILPGRRFVAAGYCLYGPPARLVFTLGDGVFEFTLDEHGCTGLHGYRGGPGADGENRDVGVCEATGVADLDFILSRPTVVMPRSGKMLSSDSIEGVQGHHPKPREGTARHDTVESTSDGSNGSIPLWLTHPSGPVPSTSGKAQNEAGTLVGEIHKVINLGGVFHARQSGRRWHRHPGLNDGELRLIYEGNPLAMIVEQAGGVATTGVEPIRDVRPHSVHHRVPAIFGSPDDLLPLLHGGHLRAPPPR